MHAPETSADLSPAALEAANINPTTGLATDYLNVFNEPVMVVGMIADMPEALDDLAEWRPIGYEEHFHNSGFAAKHVAVAAYRAMDARLRERFDAAADDLSATIVSAVSELRATAAAAEDLVALAGHYGGILQQKLAALDGLIHGNGVATAQDAIDAMFD